MAGYRFLDLIYGFMYKAANQLAILYVSTERNRAQNIYIISIIKTQFRVGFITRTVDIVGVY